MRSLQDKVAIVTGASRGIGAAIARRLAQEGAKVIVNYSQNAGAAEQVVEDIRTAGGIAIAVQADVADQAQIETLFTRTIAEYGQLDILVNNAAVAEFLPLDQVDAAHCARQFDVNVFGLLFATQQAARLMGSAGGRIIQITSGAAESAPPGGSVYSATKAAVQTLARSWAAELGPRNITVNCVSPGVTETDMMRSVLPAAILPGMIGNTALGRLGQPEDIADVVAFVASDDARWITGQVICANGGLR